MPEPGGESPHLDTGENAQAARHAPLRPLVIHEIIRQEGEAELKRPFGALFWSGLAAGLSMGFSFLTQALLRSGLPDAPWAHLVASLGYSVGFVIVVLGRQQLFTESTLTAVLPSLTNRDIATARATLRLWGIVLAANILGTLVFAAAIHYANLFRPEVLPNLVELSRETVAHPFWTTLFKAIFAGWLIGLMIWLLPSARSARLLIILVLTYLVALGRFSHIIAGSAEAAFAVLNGEATIRDYLGAFFIPTLIGNTLGGVSLVALLNHAPVRPEIDEGKD